MHVSSKHLLGTLAAMSLLSLTLLAQTRSIKPYLPESTVIVVSASDIGASLREMHEMPLAKMWAEDEVQDFVADLLKMAHGYMEQGMEEARAAHEQGMLPIDPDELAKLRLDGGTLALTRLDVGMGQMGPVPEIGIVIHLEFGESAPVWNQIIAMGLGMAEASAPPGMLASETSEIGDFTLTTLSPQGPEEQPMSLNVAMLGSGVLIGTLKDDVVNTLESLNEGEPVLTETELYESAFEHIETDGAEVEAYLRIGPLLDFSLKALELGAQMAPDFPEELDIAGIGRALDALGMRSVEAVGMATRYEGDTAVTKSYAVSPAQNRRGFTKASGGELDLDFLSWVPKDAVSLSASTLDIGACYETLVSALRAYDPDMAEMVLSQLAEIETQIDFSIRDDLFGAFGNEMISWSMPMGGAIAVAPEMAILFEVNDQEKLLKSLNVVSQLSEGAFQIETLERRGITSYQVTVNVEMPGAMGMNPLEMYRPTFAFKNGYMVMGFSAGDVRRVFDRMDRDPDPDGDIRGNAEFAPHLANLPRQGLSSIAFTDWKANFEGIYQMLTAVLAFIPVTDEVPVDFALLPDSLTLTQHLSGGISYGVIDDDGFLSTSVSPFGPELVAVAAGAGFVGAMVYSMWR